MRFWNEKIQKLIMSLKRTINIQLIRIVYNKDGGAWGAIMATMLQECYKPNELLMPLWCYNPKKTTLQLTFHSITTSFITMNEWIIYLLKLKLLIHILTYQLNLLPTNKFNF